MYRTLWLTCLWCVVHSKGAPKSNFKGPKSPRAVNVALETLLKFDDKDRAQSLRVLDNIQGLLTKLKDALVEEQVVNRASDFGYEGNDFSDFAKKAIDVLVTYTDRDLENFAKVSANEVGGCSGSVCSISELSDDDPVKDIFTKRQQQVSEATGKDIRAALKKTSHKLEYDTGAKNNEFIEYLDGIYKTINKDKLKHFIDQLQMFKARRNKASLKNIVKENLRRAVFEPYTKLEAKTRRDLILRLNTFCDEDVEGDTTDRRSEHNAATDNDNDTPLKANKRHGSRSKSSPGAKRSKVLYLRKRPRKRFTTTERVITHELGATINIGNGIDFRARMTDRSSEDENKHNVPHRRFMSQGGGRDHAASDTERADRSASRSASDEHFRRNLDNLGTKEDASKEKTSNSPEWLEETTKKDVGTDEESGLEGTSAAPPSGGRHMFLDIAEDSVSSAGSGDGGGSNTDSDGEKAAGGELFDNENDISKDR